GESSARWSCSSRVVALLMAGSPVSALRRQPGLAAVGGPIDEPVSADHPAVLLVGEAEPAQPGEHVLPELGALPRRLPGLVPHDLARGAHRPARAIGQLDHAEERVDERVLDLDLVERPALAAVFGARDASLDAGGEAALGVGHVHAVEGGKAEEVEDAGALQ